MQHTLTQSLQDIKTDPTHPLHPQQRKYEPQPTPTRTGTGTPPKKTPTGKNSRARGDPVNGRKGARRDSGDPHPDVGLLMGTGRGLGYPWGPLKAISGIRAVLLININNPPTDFPDMNPVFCDSYTLWAKIASGYFSFWASLAFFFFMQKNVRFVWKFTQKRCKRMKTQIFLSSKTAPGYPDMAVSPRRNANFLFSALRAVFGHFRVLPAVEISTFLLVSPIYQLPYWSLARLYARI